MERCFLGDVAVDLYSKFGDEISGLNVVFPNKRARLFFERELGRVIDKPIWQPNYESIDVVVKNYADVELVHNLKLIAVLYGVYKTVTGENLSFDKFYSFGEILLSDFDTIDKYLVNPKRIFTNIADLSEIDDVFEVNSIEMEIIEAFWKNYNASKGQHAQRFSKIWKHLYDIYTEFNKQLDELKIGYSGKIYRQAARKIQRSQTEDFKTFVFVGFNALNSCEKTIFKYLQNNGKALFYWDCDNYYLNDVEQEAGLFLRRNVALFGPGEIAPTRLFKSQKNIEVIKVPSEIMQARTLHSLLQNESINPAETAVILTNENLLPVVISFIPSRVEKLNITMGGQIEQSVPYVLFERIIRAQKRRQEGKYHVADVEAISNHPLIKSRIDKGREVVEELKKEGAFYVEPTAIPFANLSTIFVPEIIDGKTIGDYLLCCVKDFCFVGGEEGFAATENNEYAQAIYESIEKINNIVFQSGIEVSTTIYLNLLDQIISRERVAYLGEPLDGMQMMGILESRCIDFKNVIMLSVTDATFPSSKSVNSFIPHNLRKGFGLPTQNEHAAVWAYYFYRLVQRAQNVTLMYAATSETFGVSEPSRYIYQLEYESGHNIKQTSVELNISKQDAQKPIFEIKNDNILESLRKMTFSPSKINDYIDCPLKFCYRHIKKLSPEIPTDQINPIDTGNILHKALEEIYKPLKNNTLAQLRELTDDIIASHVDNACTDVLLQRIEQPGIKNWLEAIKKLIRKQVRLVVDFDINEGVLSSVIETERPLNAELKTHSGVVKLYGKADRVDKLNDGRVRIVDYKSGVDKGEYYDVDSLFVAQKGRPKAVLQTMIYSLMADDATPAIYNVKQMVEPNFSPIPHCKAINADFDPTDSIQREELIENLNNLFDSLTEDLPFAQTEDKSICQYCEFHHICRT